MSSRSNNPVKKEEKALPLPPKRKFAVPQSNAYTSRQQGLFPPVPFSSGSLPQNPLLPAGMTFGAVAPMQHLGFPNQGLFHASHALSGMSNSFTVAMGSGMQVSQASAGSPHFFQGWKLRSGKWLEEEEAYAELLIERFDRGLLPDCMTGATLRAYLAQKLHCAPMRISKKYAGKSIGKKVYNCRIDMRKNAPASVAEQRRKLQEKVDEAEKKFHEAASVDAPERQASPTMVPAYASLMTGTQGMPYIMPAMAASQQFFAQIPQGSFLNMNQGANFFASQQGLGSVPSVATTGTVAQVAAAPTPGSNTAQQLQDSYVKAIASHQVTGGLSLQRGTKRTKRITQSGGTVRATSDIIGGEKTKDAITSNGLQSSASSSISHMGANSGGRQSNTVAPVEGKTSNVVQILMGGMNTPQASATAKPTSAAHPGHTYADSLPPVIPMEKKQQPPTYANSASDSQQITILANKKMRSATNNPMPTITIMEQPNFPDFVAGFDKVALSIKPADSSGPPADEKNKLQCSPPFTSRSFDDFHRILGNDLTPLDDGTAALVASPDSQEKKKETSTGAKNEPGKIVLDTTALFTAESYAMFAQESALAASQHAAYLSQGRNNITHGNQRMGSFDFDSTMKLVSQHVPIAPRVDPAQRSAQRKDDRPKTSFASIFPGQPSATEKDQIEISLTLTAASDQGRATRDSAPIVSGSEPTSSAAESSFRGSTSESNGSDNTLSNSDDGHCESGDDSNDSYDDFSYDDTAGTNRKRKNTRDDSFSSGQFDESSLYDLHSRLDVNRKNKKRRLSIEP